MGNTSIIRSNIPLSICPLEIEVLVLIGSSMLRLVMRNFPDFMPNYSLILCSTMFGVRHKYSIPSLFGVTLGQSFNAILHVIFAKVNM